MSKSKKVILKTKKVKNKKGKKVKKRCLRLPLLSL